MKRVMALPAAAILACTSAATQPPDAARDASSDARTDDAYDAHDAPTSDDAHDAQDDANDAAQDAAAPLARGLYALRGYDPALPDEDLAPLDRAAEGSNVVAFGESIHTSGGFYQSKVRMIEHLVSRQGFRVVAFETPWRTAERANAYVQTCEGDVVAALRDNTHNIWWDESVAGLLRFLCAWNREHPTDRAQFVGFDQRQPWIDAPNLRRYLTLTLGSTEGPRLVDGLGTCFGVGYSDERSFFADPTVRAIFENRAAVPDSRHRACVEGALAARAVLMREREAMISRSSEADFEEARLALNDLESFDTQAWNFFFRRRFAAGQQARDTTMADVFLTLRRLRFPTARVAVWAHNAHITASSDTIAASVYRGVTNFGTLLARSEGVRYAAVGLTGWDVRYDWQQGPATLEAPADGSFEARIHGRGVNALWVDLREASEGDSPTLARDPMVFGGFETFVPREQFRAVIFLEESPPMRWIAPGNPFTSP